MFFHALYEREGVDVYTAQVALELSGVVSAEGLKRACGVLLERHANLRTGFRSVKSGSAVQAVFREVELEWRDVDLKGLPAGERDAVLSGLLREEREKRFDLARPPLIRFLLVRLTDDRYSFVVSNHHIVLDGWSMPLLVQELFVLYGNGGDVSVLPRVTPYKDYLSWLAGQDRAEAAEAWRQALAGLEEPCRLAPVARGRELTSPERIEVEVEEEVTLRLEGWARSRGLTMNTLVQGVWAVLLGSLTGRDDVVFGATVSGRPPEVAGMESMVGLFINTVPVRVRVDPSQTLEGFFRQVQDGQARLMPHQYVGLTEIHELAGVGELFDTLTVFENYPLDAGRLSESLGEVAITGAQAHDATHYPMTIVATLQAHRLHLRFDYMPDLFDRDAAVTLTRRFARVLEQVTDNTT
ncbi:condensation domain-containing protein, partial [Streptomyces sp. NPDC048208]|uniref:condensation domain-containing protein n=1 Tax=Streptomyces sp. NPDC048208 TaxID=3365515 RepID=UPI0037103E06